MGNKENTWGGKREGAGRPSLFDGEEKRPINLRLTTTAIDTLTAKSEFYGVSKSDLVSGLILKEETHNQIKKNNMRGIITFSSQKDIIDKISFDYLQVLEVSINEFFKSPGAELEVKKAVYRGGDKTLRIISVNVIGSDSDALFIVEAIVDDTVVLKYDSTVS